MHFSSASLVCFLNILKSTLSAPMDSQTRGLIRGRTPQSPTALEAMDFPLGGDTRPRNVTCPASDVECVTGQQLVQRRSPNPWPSPMPPSLELDQPVTVEKRTDRNAKRDPQGNLINSGPPNEGDPHGFPYPFRGVGTNNPSSQTVAASATVPGINEKPSSDPPSTSCLASDVFCVAKRDPRVNLPVGEGANEEASK